MVFECALTHTEKYLKEAEERNVWPAQKAQLCARVSFLAAALLSVIYLPVGVIHGFCIVVDPMRWKKLDLSYLCDLVVLRVDRFFKGLVGALLAPSIITQFRDKPWGTYVLEKLASIVGVNFNVSVRGGRYTGGVSLGGA